MRSITLLLAAMLASAPVSAQTRTSLLPTEVGANDLFGSSVALDGDYAVIGSPDDDDKGTNMGAVYIYHWNGIAWVQQSKVLSPDGRGGRFGLAVAIEDDHIVVGTTSGGLGTGEGRAYVFRLTGETWTHVKTLSASDRRMDGHFGISVAISGDRILVGAENGGKSTDSDVQTGAAYVFERHLGGVDNWGFRQKLNASDETSGQNFGQAVALEGDDALIGAPGAGPGAAYVFRFDGTSWKEVLKWTAPKTKSAFGFSVALDGEHALVGARDETSGPIPSDRRGAAYAYRRSGSTWPAAGQRLTAFDGAGWDRFGHAVTVSGNLAVVGAPGDDDNADDAGSVYLYRWDGTAWMGLDAPKLSGSRTYGYFGHAVALRGGDLIASAYQDSERGQRAGKAFAYVLVPRPVTNLRASDGTSDTGIDLSWNDTAGEDGYRIYRDGTLVETRGANVTAFRDAREPDRVHEYGVVAYNALSESPPVMDIGRTRANGRISGDVKAGNTGVPGALVSATPYANRALALDGTSGYVEVPHRAALEVGTQFTVEAWVLPATLEGRPTVFSTRRRNEVGSWQFEVGTGNNGSGRVAVTSLNTWVIESPDGALTPGRWAHVAYTRDGTTHRLYVDGVQVAEQELDYAFVDNDAPKLIGAGTNLSASAFFNGSLDEVRLWSRARTADEIRQEYGHRLAGDEAGLKGYWRMDAGAGPIVVDYTQNGSHGALVGSADGSAEGAPVLLAAPTNAQGAYSIREISYGTGTAYTVTPRLDGHGFDPARRENVELNSTTPVIAGITFADTTAFVVSGRVAFAGTPCAATGVDILVDGVKRGAVRADGTYEVTILTPGTVTITPAFAGHTFSPAERVLTVVDNLTDIDFDDTQTYTLSGKAVGGDCNLALGADGRVDLTVTGGGGCLVRQVKTDASGRYAVELPALAQVSVEASVPNEPSIQFTPRPVSLRDASQTVDFVYRSRPEITLAGFPADAGQCGIPVLEQLQPYDFTIEAKERYGSQTCAVEDGFVIVRNDVADDATPDTLRIQGGQASYAFTAGGPNVVGGGPRPYQKLLQAEVVTGGGPEAGPYGYRESVSRWVVVEGSRPRAATFATTSPQLPLFILHDPPGDKSYSFIEKEEATCTATSFSALRGGSTGGWGAVRLGTKFEAGLGFSTETSLWGELKNTLTAEKTSVSRTEQEMCFTATQRFSTGSDEHVTAGTGGDVFVGAALNITYALTDDLDYNEAICRADLSHGVAFGLGGFATEYTYTEQFIRENLVPRLEMLRDLPATPRDSVAYYDNQVRVWKQTLALNANNKAALANAPAVVNRSFDGSAGPVEETQTFSTSAVETVEFNLVIADEVAVEAGLEIGGSGLSGGATVTVRKEDGGSTATSRTASSTTGYVLDDDDANDFFSVDVKADPVYGTPVFQLKSGTSSCVWEPGTQPREGVQLTANTLVRSNVSPDGAASFQLTLGNTSQSDEGRAYQLFALSESNPDGAVLAVNGFAIGDLAPVTIAPGASVNQTLTVRRGPEAFTYPELKIGLRSTCDPLAIADTLSLAVHFQNTCSPVTLAAPTDGWVVNRASTTPTRILVRDYVAAALTNLKIQYAPVGTNSWQTARVVPAAELPEGFFQMDWDTRGLPDGAYQIRVAVECAAGTTFSEPVAGVIDRSAPALFGTPEPSDGFWQAGDVIRATFDEALDPATVTAANVALADAKTGAPVPAQVQYADRQILVTPGGDVAALEGASLRVTLTNLADLRGNTLAAPVAWQFRVQQSPVAWSRVRLAFARPAGALAPETATLANTGPTDMTFDITRHPAWLTPTPAEGTVAAQDVQTVVFTPDAALAPGLYRDTVVAQTPGGPARLAVELDVSCSAPAWQVDAAAFSHSMNVTAGFYLDGVPFSSQTDRVAAFAGAEVRGVATVQPRVPQDDYLAFLTVYSNQASGEDIRFELWDASECKTMSIAEPITFEAGAATGTPTQPTRLTVSGAVLQTIPLAEGVTWISLGVEAQDMATPNVLGRLQPAEGDRIQGQTRFSQYAAGQGWVGTLDTLRAGVLYKMHVAHPQPLPFIGQPVSGQDRPLAITQGWNWLGYLPDAPLPLATALVSLPPHAGDLVKSQTAFAQFDGGAWQGSLATMRPGAGYLFKTGTPGTLVYPDAAGPRVEFETVVAGGPPAWQVDAADYEFAMAVTGTLQLDGVATGKDAIVAAFADGEVRGVARPVFALDRWTYFLTVYGRRDGEAVTFRAYDARRDVVRPLSQQVTFAAEAGHGTPREPFVFDTITPTAADDEQLPVAFSLDANAPNPFGKQTTIRYALPERAPVRLDVYDLLGRHVATLVAAEQTAGRYAVTVEAEALASGVYVYRLQAGRFSGTRQMVVAR